MVVDNIFIRFGTKLYRQTICIPMGTNCAPPVADLFLFSYESDFMKSLSHENQADIIEAFAIVILNFIRRFRNFIADTVPC